MNKCIFQYWEESERGYGVRPGGCSIHSSLEEHMNFINSIYSSRTDEVPQEYDRVVGDPIVCFVSDEIFERILLDSSIRISENEKNNLIDFEDLIFNL
jgi:hypothetical protein